MKIPTPSIFISPHSRYFLSHIFKLIEIKFANEIKTFVDIDHGTGLFSKLSKAMQRVRKNELLNKSMPPAGKTPLTDGQIAKIACWVEDGASQ